MGGVFRESCEILDFRRYGSFCQYFPQKVWVKFGQKSHLPSFLNLSPLTCITSINSNHLFMIANVPVLPVWPLRARCGLLFTIMSYYNDQSPSGFCRHVSATPKQNGWNETSDSIWISCTISEWCKFISQIRCPWMFKLKNLFIPTWPFMAKGTFLSSPTYNKQLEYKHNRKSKSYLGQTGLV